MSDAGVLAKLSRILETHGFVDDSDDLDVDEFVNEELKDLYTTAEDAEE
jgi:hypothetical protein